jgi:hypothetical protein
MKRAIFSTILLLFSSIITSFGQDAPPNLTDFWEGRAMWQLETADIGLPEGESDTVQISDQTFWSYLHASDQSAGIIDQCGTPVQFPGCTTLWISEDGMENFAPALPMCLLSCAACPCEDERDHITAQQYPRVVRAADGWWYMVYEWHAQTILRRSQDGIEWSDWDYLRVPGGVWPRSFAECLPVEEIGEHPNIRGEGDVCIVGGPPGLYVEGDMLYVFVMAGSAPAHMRCYKGNRHGDLGELQRCDTDPLFGGAREYGAEDIRGSAANAYFDFRYISSADVIHDGQYYYMAYEGIRGPDVLEFGRDNQFGLGFARSEALDSPWELYAGNPILGGLMDNWGIGHADLLIVDGVTYMITATSTSTRGRYRLAWRSQQ